MTTYYGLNPSFCFSSPLPLLASPIARARRFEIFDDAGRPIGEASLLSEGWPVEDGRRHGVRLLEGLPISDAARAYRDWLVILGPSGAGSLSWTRRPTSAALRMLDVLPFTPQAPRLHIPSLEALASLRPRVFRTLDLGWQARRDRRPDWSRGRVLPSDLIQGEEMAVEIQAKISRLLHCNLWWNAPPRFELSVAEYETRLEEYLVAIRDSVELPPVIEYVNEIWNAGFPVHGWLHEPDGHPGRPEDVVAWSWHRFAAREIQTLKRVADRVFGQPRFLGARPYWLFVGGQLTVPSHMDRLLSELAGLGVTPDLAGPALYVTPLKAHKEEWEATGSCPTQDELRASCLARLEEIATGINDPTRDPMGPLAQHAAILARHRVPYFACYEAGQSLLADGHPWRRAAIEAQRTEWMGELYRGIRRVAEAAGVDVLNWYSACTIQDPRDPRLNVHGLLEGVGAPLLSKALAARGD